MNEQIISRIKNAGKDEPASVKSSTQEIKILRYLPTIDGLISAK